MSSPTSSADNMDPGCGHFLVAILVFCYHRDPRTHYEFSTLLNINLFSNQPPVAGKKKKSSLLNCFSRIEPTLLCSAAKIRPLQHEKP